jgi:hypothetical protein
MKATGVIVLCLAALVTTAFGADDYFLDQVDDALTFTAFHDRLRARLSGTFDLEGYFLQQPAPGLLFTDQDFLLIPRLSLFLDAQLGPHIYVFAESRVDRGGFDPGQGNIRPWLNEYAVRFTPRDDTRLNLQIGQFATVVGNWVPRHGSWDNPFVTAPLPYEHVLGIWDEQAGDSAATILEWAHIQPRVSAAMEYADKNQAMPVIWGPGYTSGAALTGATEQFDYAVEFKNASLSSRPESWPVTSTNWRYPTVSGRVGYRPDEMWNLGVSASAGSYLRPELASTLPAGHGLDDYRETVLGQDAEFAWHYWQIWAECYETRFAIPLVGNADTLAYYLEAKYKFTPQFFGALRWNQELFSTIPDGAGGFVRWERPVWRVDVAPSYRFTPHTQVKIQYSIQHEDLTSRWANQLLAVQFTIRF